MQPQELQTYLYTHIPLAQAMQVTVLSIEPQQLVVQAPLAPNVNPHHTVFGGSIAAIATLAAWCFMYTRLEAASVASSLVVRRSQLEYERPIAGEFTVTASFENPNEWEGFLTSFQERGKGKLAVIAVLEYAGQVTGRFRGEFVALKK